MRMRLAFAVAISAEPEIFLIDEILSVGDLRFQQKCFDRLAEMQLQGTTIMFCSHDESQVKELCNRVVWLAHGTMQAQGAPDDVFDAYKGAMRAESARRAASFPIEPRHGGAHLELDQNRFGTLEVEIAAVRVEPARVEVPRGAARDSVRIEIDLVPRVVVDNPVVGVSIRRMADGSMVADINSQSDGVRITKLDAPRTVVLELGSLDVSPGAYHVDVGIYQRDWEYVYDYHWQAYSLEVAGSGRGFGPPRAWLV
jgi:lipopolysaccharide transport system ATP-binding protein